MSQKSEKYLPQPVDTSNICLPQELENLVEQLARNVHEVWASSRIAQGWTWGPVRSDAFKTHPSLVPYEELSEEERFKKLCDRIVLARNDISLAEAQMLAKIILNVISAAK